MAQARASHQRLAALTGAAELPTREAPEPGTPSPDAPHRSGPDPEVPDPQFWGPEPRAVRRSRRSGAEPAARRDAHEWWTGALERARDLRLEVGIGVLVVVLVAGIAGVVWYRIGVGGADGPPTAERTAAGAPASRAPSGGEPALSASTAEEPVGSGSGRRGPAVVVYVAGAVAKPGVLLMPAGARVIDAVEGAGGALPDADLDRLNLAAKLTDGQRVLVSKVGAVALGDPGAPADGSGAGLIDLNSATSPQLEALPGIGPALAGAILAERDRRGGFRSVNELREVRGIGEARFAELRERVTV